MLSLYAENQDVVDLLVTLTEFLIFWIGITLREGWELKSHCRYR